MKYERIKDIYIPQNILLNVKKMGEIIEVTFNSNQNNRAQIIKLNEKDYYVVKTGEVRQFKKKIENRSENINSIRKTMKKIKELIQNNVTDISKVRWCTLTYANNMKDTQQLYEDFKKFNQKFQRYLNHEKINKAEYIAIIEPQERGAWHFHILYIFKERAPYISNEIYSKLWGHGFTKITKIDKVTNIAVYLMAYLSDIEIPIENKEMFYENEVKEIETEEQRKAFIKGKRLVLYPRGINIVRHSRGIKYPVTQKMTTEQVEELVRDKKLTYHTMYRLSNDEGYTTNIDKKEYKNRGK